MKRLMDYLPEQYQNSTETKTFQEALQPEIDLVWRAREELLMQLDPNTATWGLFYWEDSLGLVTDEYLPYSVRRNRVVTRLRGMGTTTPAKIKSVVEDFCPGCMVSVVEHFEKYLVEIRLVITDRGVEDNDGMYQLLQLIMPAHLAWGFAITLKSIGAITFGAAEEMSGKMEIWPLVVREIDTTATVSYGAGTDTLQKMRVYPSAAKRIDAFFEPVLTGGMTYGLTLEIYPQQGGIANG